MINMILKTIKKMIAFILVLLLFYISYPIKSNAYSNIYNSAEEKVFSNVSINDDFEKDCIMVVMKKDVSAINKEYNKDFFGNLPIEKINDITYVSNEITSDTSLNLREFRQILQLKLIVNTKQDVVDIIKEIEKIDDVLCVSPNYVIHLDKQPSSASIPSTGEHRYPELWGLHGNVGIKAEEAWDFTTGNSQVRVGVIDTGLFSHMDLAANVSTEGGDFVNMIDESINIPGSLRDDPSGHGTHVSGIIGATGVNPNGVTGVAWNVQLIPLQTSYWDSTENDWLLNFAAIVRSITWCANNNVDIINFSAGLTADDPAIRNAISNFNGLFVAAAGNGGSDGVGDDNDSTRYYPSDYSRGQTFSDRVISVGAYREVSSGADICDFSNFGQNSVSIFAPGENILSCFPNNICNNFDYVFDDETHACEMSSSFLGQISGLGPIDWEYLDDHFSEIVLIYGVDETTPGMFITSNHDDIGYHYMNGTSMATPYVTGTAAILWNILSNSPENYTRLQIASMIKTSIISSATKNDTGTPFNDKCVADGRLNAFGAVKYALNYYILTSSTTLNNSITTTYIYHTALSNNDYFTNDNGFYKLDVTYTRGYNFYISSSYPITVTLYNSNYNIVSYNDLNNSANIVSFDKELYTGTYYLRVEYNDSSQSGTITTQISKHSHSYGASYSWHNYTQHHTICGCGAMQLEYHVTSGTVPGQQYATCLLCGGLARLGLVGPMSLNTYPHTINGSYILPNGVVVLVDEDIDAYFAGTLVFINPGEYINRSNSIPYILKREYEYLLD